MQRYAGSTVTYQLLCVLVERKINKKEEKQALALGRYIEGRGEECKQKRVPQGRKTEGYQGILAKGD